MSREDALFAARLHIEKGTLLSTEAVSLICKELLHQVARGDDWKARSLRIAGDAQRLHEALCKYGDHDSECRALRHTTCVCGLDQMIDLSVYARLEGQP